MIIKLGKTAELYCTWQSINSVIFGGGVGRSGHKSQLENRSRPAGVMTDHLKSATNSYIIHNPIQGELTGEQAD